MTVNDPMLPTVVVVSADPADAARARLALELLRRHCGRSGLPPTPLTSAPVLHAVAHGGTNRTEIDTNTAADHGIRMPDPMLLDAPTAAARVGVSERTLRRLTADGHIQRLKIGARTYYSPDQLYRFVASLNPEPTEETPHADR